MPEELFPLKKLLAILDTISPFSLAEPWDNVGLMAGDPEQQVTGILVALDPTEAVIAEALSHKLNTIITHHPLLFHPVKKIDRSTPIGRMLAAALSQDLAIVACHTNLDLIADGVSNALAVRLGLTETRPLTEKSCGTGAQTFGFGKIGTLATPLPARQFIEKLFSSCRLPGVQIAGPLPETIRRVALCGGSGSELAESAFALGADVFLTGEVKHSTARWAEAAGRCLIDAGHYATEQLVVPVLAELLTKACGQQGFFPPIRTAENQNNPMQWVVCHENNPLFVNQQTHRG
ncbi:Nif3-like dinuclear metal center hexameric protein [Thiovibrio sp. JS02]